MSTKWGTKRVLVVPDMQIPFHHQDSFKFLYEQYKTLSPDLVVCIGDSVDFHTLSKYQANPDGYSGGDELKLSKKYLKEFYQIFPEGVEVFSNHNSRAMKKAFAAGIPKAFMKEYADVVEAPEGWEFFERFAFDGVMYEHGDAFQGEYAAKTAARTNMQSTVIGHHHSHASIHYLANNNKTLWGMNVGCLIDINSYAFEYAKTYKSKPILSCGVVDNGVPRLIPMILDERNRWNKRA